MLENIRKRIGRTIYKQNLLQEGDRILIGLSGGKDSFVLLDSLVDRKKYLPFAIEVIATHIHINNIGYQSDLDYLQKLCDERGVDFHPIDFEIEITDKTERSMCFYCSWNRRKTLFKLTQLHNCNKLALGHHMDDAVETMLMNQLFHSSISSMPYKFSMFEERIEVIRPLLDLRDFETKKYASALNYQHQLKDCPYTNTKRESVRKLIKSMEKMNKVAVKNIFRSPNKIFNEYLPLK